MKASKFICGLLSLTLLLTACSSTPSESSTSTESSVASTSDGQTSTASSESTSTKAENADTISFAVTSEPGKLDPQNNPNVFGMQICRQIYDTLVVKDNATGDVLPSLATECEWVDDTHLSMTLRDDVFFHNGTKLTAEDVKFTIGRFAEGSATSSLYKPFDAENTEVVDDTHIIIAFSSPFAPALNFLTNGRAHIVSKAYFEENGDECLNQNAMGTGPYKFTGWEIGIKVTMERNDDYWGEKAIVPKAEVLFLNDISSRMIALESGDIDIVCELSDEDAARALAGEIDGVIGYKTPSWKVWWFGFNTESFDIFKDERVRLAIAHAVDWEAVAQTAGEINATPAKSALASTIFGYKEVGLYEYDPELSKQLLADAGYQDGFEFTATEEEYPASVRALEAMQPYLQEIGVTMNIEVVDAATENDMNARGVTQAAIFNMTAMTGDPAHTLNGTVKASATITGRTQDEYYNELYDRGMAEMDEDARRAIYEEIQDYIFEHALQIPVFEQIVTYATRDYVKGFVPDAGMQIEFKSISIE